MTSSAPSAPSAGRDLAQTKAPGLDTEAAAGLVRLRSDPAAFMRDWLGTDLWHKQIEIAQAVRDHRRVAVKSCHGSGKCVYNGSMIVLADGRVVPARDLVGRYFAVPAFLPDGQQAPRLAWATDNGVKPVFRVHTERGRVIERTGTHPLCAAHLARNRRERMTPEPRGWVAIDALCAGDLVLVPEHLDVHGQRPRREDEVKLAGFLLGDGGTTVRVAFSQQEGAVRDEFVALVERLGGRVAPSGLYNLTVLGAGDGGRFEEGHNPVLTLVREWGLLGKKAVEKTFPAWAWELPNAQLALLLNRLFACDGWAYLRRAPQRGTEHGEIGFASASLALLRDVELALLRLGICGHVRQRTMTLGANEFPAWEWSTKRAPDIQRFAATVGIFGKEAAVDRVVAWSRTIDVDRTVKWRHINAPAGYHWERIKSIEPMGEQPTVSISVDEAHTFVTTFVEHNSFLSARLVLWFLHAYPGSIVITTAPTYNQVTNILWREIGTAHASSRAPLLGRYLTTRYEIAPDWYALGFKASDTQPDRFQGFHAEHALVVIDEAAGVADMVYEALDAVLTSEAARLLLIGNPTNASGTFYDAFHMARALYHTITIAADDTPNVQAGRTVRPYLLTQQWIDDALTKHGPESDYVRCRVHAQFPQSDSSALIPLAWIEAADARRAERPAGAFEAGLDVARGGEDECSLAVRQGMQVVAQHSWSGPQTRDTMATVGKVQHLLEPYAAALGALKVDVVGIGAGVHDRLAEMGYPAVPVNAGAQSSDLGKWQNLRCEMYWTMRELFHEGVIAGPLDDVTMGQGASIRGKYTSRFTMPVIESKDDAKRRGVRSPDRFEALMLAFTNPPETAMARVWFA